ncbi:hypothetical protein MCUN1_002660 [Malassezia cuniculi]|uniref:Uncharacterized protein n=1 Tax=Malassezia cuniculi TaxID=948313 RepID=A0AAF0EVG3_9BASI|nr:hypothetical protein MCUN1_002660 [Malassezia cuniculi]
MYFLSHSRYTESPTLWTLQAMIMIRTFFFAEIKFRDLVLWQATIVRLAQSMNLHRLGSIVLDVRRPPNQNSRTGAPDAASGSITDFNDMSTSDTTAFLEKLNSLRVGYIFGLSFEPHNLVAREIARKIWMGIVYSEIFLASHLDHCYNINCDVSSTMPPADLDEDEVLVLNVAYRENPVALEKRLLERRHAKSSGYNAYYSIIKSVKRQVDIENEFTMRTGHVFLDYDLVQQIDLDARQCYSALPDHLRYWNGTPPEHVRKLHLEFPYYAEQSFFFEEQYNIRLLGLHITYMLRGMDDPMYRRSTEVCIESARHLISMTSRISEELAMTPFGEILNRKVYLAVIVLHVANCYGDKSFASSEISDDIRAGLIAIKNRQTMVFLTISTFFSRAVSELSDIYFTSVGSGANESISSMNTLYEDPLQWLSALGYAHLFDESRSPDGFAALNHDNVIL